MVSQSVVVFLGLLAFASATNVMQCEGQSHENLSDRVQLTPCSKSPCKLKKGTNQHISINFTPNEDLEELKNHVTAEVYGVPLPFIGVDGESTCGKVYTETGEKASCPLKAGINYVYKDSFPILSFYPNINVKVHWALQHNNDNIICFEVPARITGK